jgi:hypothetical protein
MTAPAPDPRLTWITQALNDAAQGLPPAARAAYVAQANAELGVIAGALHSAAQETPAASLVAEG